VTHTIVQAKLISASANLLSFESYTEQSIFDAIEKKAKAPHTILREFFLRMLNFKDYR
jgi:hypothetical protein